MTSSSFIEHLSTYKHAYDHQSSSDHHPPFSSDPPSAPFLPAPALLFSFNNVDFCCRFFLVIFRLPNGGPFLEKSNHNQGEGASTGGSSDDYAYPPPPVPVHSLSFPNSPVFYKKTHSAHSTLQSCLPSLRSTNRWHATGVSNSIS